MSGSHRATISKLPPELLFHTFLFLSDELAFGLRHLCLVRKSWHPPAQAILYRSVELLDNRIPQFARTLEESNYLAPLVKHLTLYRMESSSDWVFVHKIIEAISKPKTLRSYDLHPICRFDLGNSEMLQSISLISFLRHIVIDTYIFVNVHAMKTFIASFPHLDTLEVREEACGEFKDTWFDEPASATSLDFPSTIRTLALRQANSYKVVDAVLQWVPRRLPIEHLSFPIKNEDNEASLRSTLWSLGTVLKSLELDYRRPMGGLPTIDLSANTNLRSLSLTIHHLLEDYTPDLVEHLSILFGSLSSPVLQPVKLDLTLSIPDIFQLDYTDWGVLDEATGSAEVRMSLRCHEKQAESIKERITLQMPQHRAQGKLQWINCWGDPC